MNTLMKKNSNGQVPAAAFGGMVDKLFHNNVNRIFDDHFWGFTGLDHKVTVPVNIRETGTGFEVDVVAPGHAKGDFRINVNGETLTISLEHKEEAAEQNKEEGWLRNEYRKQSFSRSFGINETIDAAKITATYTDGILHVSLPKKEGAQNVSRTIEIQ